MEQQSDPRARRVATLARQYRRDGYKVTQPKRDTPRPAFLGDHVPDLIAELDEDRVVVEVKNVAAIRGANDLVDLAQRIEREPGWRMELVTVAAKPQAVHLTSDGLTVLRDEIAALVEARFFKAAFLTAFAGIERLLRTLAVEHRINPDKITLARLVSTLATEGLVSSEQYHHVNAVIKSKDRLIHFDEKTELDGPKIDRIVALIEGLYAETMCETA